MPKEVWWGAGVTILGVGIGIIGAVLAKTSAIMLGIILIAVGLGVILWAQFFRKTPSLEKRVYKLVDALVELQREQGPEPPHALSGKGRSVAEQKRVFDAYFDWQHNTYFKYIARLKDQVVEIDSELAAERIFTKLDRNEIDPPETIRQVDLRKIITALRSARDEILKRK